MDYTRADYIVGLCFGAIIGLLFGIVWQTASYETQLVDRGLAVYCPADGEFAFIGECDHE